MLFFILKYISVVLLHHLDIFRDFQSLEIKSYLDQILMCLRFIILGIIIKMNNIYKYIVKTKIKSL
jgi:hypothetical protein